MTLTSVVYCIKITYPTITSLTLMGVWSMGEGTSRTAIIMPRAVLATRSAWWSPFSPVPAITMYASPIDSTWTRDALKENFVKMIFFSSEVPKINNTHMISLSMFMFYGFFYGFRRRPQGETLNMALANGGQLCFFTTGRFYQRVIYPFKPCFD